MKTLIIVNCQSDFISGTMCTKSSKEIVPEIKTFIKENRQELDKIIFVLDWHPYNHCSFKKYGGEYPSHCVQYTPGACIEPKLLKYIQSLEIPYECVLKGIYEEFDEKGLNDIEYVKDCLGERIYFNSSARANWETDFVVCGITNDVINILEDLLESQINPFVYTKGTYADEKKLTKFVKDRGIEKI